MFGAMGADDNNMKAPEFDENKMKEAQSMFETLLKDIDKEAPKKSND